MTMRGAVVLAALLSSVAGANDLSPAPRPLRLRPRSRVAANAGHTKLVVRGFEWNPCQTAIVVCDMWDAHYCKSAERRVAEMAPRMNQVLDAARRRGVTIIHAPSGTMDFYAKTPARLRMSEARPATPPVPFTGWREFDPAREGAWPIDDKALPCDDPVIDPSPRPATRQTPVLDVRDTDGVSDSGEEIYNFCAEQGIRNIVFMGIHTNKCVLGRSFGIRQMVDLGMNVVLVRDLTDATYDPRKFPWVSHERGTELVVKHIETYWCPSILAEDLAR